MEKLLFNFLKNPLILVFILVIQYLSLFFAIQIHPSYTSTYARIDCLYDNFDMSNSINWRDESALRQSFARGEASSLHTSRLLEPGKGTAMERPGASMNALIEAQLRHGEKRYDRKKDLPGLLHLFPGEIDKLDHASKTAILHRLTSLLKTERARGKMGHWRYSLARHIGLMQALRAEKIRLSAL